LGAEQRGQAEAIARNIMEMAGLQVPVISIVIGEGGSGGALAIAVANHVYMLENAIYSVISPEGCASILMKDAKQASDAAELLRITAKDALELGVIEGIIEEPLGGAHREPAFAADGIKKSLRESLRSFRGVVPSELRQNRHRRFMRMGEVRLATGEEFAKI
jgi:acetyl-CoA carboxylase carboxyl transferase subunit alpha